MCSSVQWKDCKQQNSNNSEHVRNVDFVSLTHIYLCQTEGKKVLKNDCCMSKVHGNYSKGNPVCQIQNNLNIKIMMATDSNIK